MARTKIPGYSQPSRPDPTAGSSNTKWIAVAVAVAVAVVAVVAVAVVGARDSGTVEGVEVADSVRIAGEDLPALTDGEDAAVGREMPTLSGTSSTGAPVEFSGGPRVVVVVAHWCPFCQKEVPRITELVSSGRWPEQVALEYVSTAQDRTKGNWSPSEWFAREKVDAPVLVDDAGGTLYRALGVSGFPFLIGVDADGKVAWRVSGEQDPARLEELANSLVPAAPGTTAPAPSGAPAGGP